MKKIKTLIKNIRYLANVDLYERREKDIDAIKKGLGVGLPKFNVVGEIKNGDIRVAKIIKPNEEYFNRNG